MIKNKFLQLLLAFSIYILVTCCIFYFRIDGIFIKYGMPDMDSDSTIWNYARDFSLYSSIPNRIVDSYWSFPIGYKWSGSPYAYDYVVDVINYIFVLSGYNLKILMFLVNLNVLLTYVLTAFFSFLLFRKYTQYQILAFLWWLLVGFWYYQLLYAKGSMSINNFWVIPLFYYFFVNFIREKSFFRALICIATIAITAGISPYWAFYILLFSPVFVFHEWLKKQDIKIYFWLYLCFALAIILGNLNYFLLNKDFLSVSNMVEIGRVAHNFSPINEMVPHVSWFFIELRGENLDWNRLRGFSIGYILLFGLIMTLFVKNFLQKNKFLYIFSLLGVALYVYTPATYLFNEWYFSIFGAFKGVLRLHIIVTLLIVLILVLFFDEYLWKFEKKSNKFFIILGVIIVLSFFQIYRNIPLYEKTWNHQTDFSKITEVYSILRNDKINSVLFYPTYLDNVIVKGFWWVPNQQSLSQVVHGKPIVWWVDTRSDDPEGHQQYFRDITNFESDDNKWEFDIEKLKKSMQKYYINTFVVFNRKLKNAEDINWALQDDNDFEFIGRKSAAYDDENYFSLKDQSMDISVYLYKNVDAKIIWEYKIEDDVGKLEKIGINAYKISLKKWLKKDDIIEVYLPTDVKWNIQLVSKNEDINWFWLFKNREKNQFEKIESEFFNHWRSDGDHEDKYDIVIAYSGDNKYIYALFISGLFYIFIFVIIIYLWIRKWIKK